MKKVREKGLGEKELFLRVPELLSECERGAPREPPRKLVGVETNR